MTTIWSGDDKRNCQEIFGKMSDPTYQIFKYITIVNVMLLKKELKKSMKKIENLHTELCIMFFQDKT